MIFVQILKCFEVGLNLYCIMATLELIEEGYGKVQLTICLHFIGDVVWLVGFQTTVLTRDFTESHWQTKIVWWQRWES